VSDTVADRVPDPVSDTGTPSATDIERSGRVREGHVRVSDTGTPSATDIERFGRVRERHVRVPDTGTMSA
jgi:hypothetical protein